MTEKQVPTRKQGLVSYSAHMAKIILENMEFYAFHGCYAAERTIGATYSVTIEIEADCEAAGHTDNLCDTIDCEAAYNVVKAEMEQPSNLIEHVAYRIKRAITAAFDRAERVTVTVSKIAPPIGGPIARTTVIV